MARLKKINWLKFLILLGFMFIFLGIINFIFFIKDSSKFILYSSYILLGIGFLTLFIGLIILFILNFKIIIKKKKKYIILIIVLILIFIILRNNSVCPPYSGPPELKIQNECFNLSAEECFQSPSCKGFYGPSSCSCNICTEDIAYKGCIKISEDIIHQSRTEKDLCEKTNGSWITNVFQKPGECGCSVDQLENGSNSKYGIGQIYFNDIKGCISEKRACEEEGGYWKDPEPFNVAERPDIPKEECVTSSVFALLNWSKEKKVCIITEFYDPYPKCV